MTPPTPKGIVEALAEKAFSRFAFDVTFQTVPSAIAQTFAPVEKLIEAAQKVVDMNQGVLAVIPKEINYLSACLEELQRAARGATNGKA